MKVLVKANKDATHNTTCGRGSTKTLRDGWKTSITIFNYAKSVVFLGPDQRLPALLNRDIIMN